MYGAATFWLAAHSAYCCPPPLLTCTRPLPLTPCPCRVVATLELATSTPTLPLTLRQTALLGALQLAAACSGPASALALAVQQVANGGLSLAASTPAALLTDAALYLEPVGGAGGSESAGGLQNGGDAPAASSPAAPGLSVSMADLEGVVALLNAGYDCRLRHMAFWALRQLQGEVRAGYRGRALVGQMWLCVRVWSC